jgi:hypothetical protein
MALDNTRSDAWFCSSLGVGAVLTTLVILPGSLPACGIIQFGGRALLVTGMVLCAAAFVRCPRHRLAHKSVTLVCFALSVLLATEFVGRYLVSRLSDGAAFRVLLAYERLGL